MRAIGHDQFLTSLMQVDRPKMARGFVQRQREQRELNDFLKVARVFDTAVRKMFKIFLDFLSTGVSGFR